jgi:hypothetical protein
MTCLTFLVSCAYACLGVNLRTRRKEHALETLKIDAEVCAYAQRRVKGVPKWGPQRETRQTVRWD